MTRLQPATSPALVQAFSYNPLANLYGGGRSYTIWGGTDTDHVNRVSRVYEYDYPEFYGWFDRIYIVP